jgi:glyoxylase-like metal-dependent hydrolase (beta-lactamase superfamily II)/rhodanese-related sulfurtransferase
MDYDVFKPKAGGAMIFRQLFDPVSSTYTYLLASRHGGEALIIDPVLERVDRYIQLLNELDLRLVKAIDTHLHADHITGLDALRERTQCITVMGEQSKAEVVSIRVADGDRVGIEGLSLDVAYTPGHTDDSYSYILPDRVFTGDTLLIRGTGRTDFQNGDARAQYDSIFNRLLKLPDETFVYPAHDYKGDTVSTIAEERAFNPRLQVKSLDEYVALMNNLHLPNPKMMDVAVPANMRIGLAQNVVADRGWALGPDELRDLLATPHVALIDLREEQERRKHGIIPGSLHVPYPTVQASLRSDGPLRQLAQADKRLVFYCAYGERSAMALQAAQAAGFTTARHLHGGMQAWKRASGAVAA